MKRNQTFDKHHSRLVWEAVIKSLVCGLSVGFAVMFGVGLGTWIAGVNGLWFALAAWAVIGAGATLLFYFKRFKPTAKKDAARLDRLGLEERLITMLELEGDDSYIAQRQRADAKEKLQQVNVKDIKFRIPVASIVLAAVLTVFGAGMTTVTALSAKGLIDTPAEIIKPLLPEEPPVYCNVIYGVMLEDGETEGGGYIEGLSDQVVIKGEDAEPVVAVAEEGFVFQYWLEDESKDPARHDKKIEDENPLMEVTYTAIFAEVGEGGEGESESGDGEGEPSEEPQESENGGSDDGDPSKNPTAGGEYTENDQIKDGNTDLKDTDLLEQYLAALESGDIPPEWREIIEQYLETLK